MCSHVRLKYCLSAAGRRRAHGDCGRPPRIQAVQSHRSHTAQPTLPKVTGMRASLTSELSESSPVRSIPAQYNALRPVSMSWSSLLGPSSHACKSHLQALRASSFSTTQPFHRLRCSSSLPDGSKHNTLCAPKPPIRVSRLPPTSEMRQLSFHHDESIQCRLQLTL